jgi:hypothetical protein
MNKNIYIFLMVLFFVLISPNVIFAEGTIQLVSFQNQIKESVGSDFYVPINFIYSGSYSDQLGVSIVGTNGFATSLPPGVNLSAINHGINGVDSITLSGIPTASGDYPLSLIITDNNGALLTQSFDFSVASNNSYLPDAVVYQSYSQNVFVGYPNDSGVVVHFSAWQNNLPSGDVGIQTPIANSYDGYTILRLNPYKTGKFVIEADIKINDILVNTEMFGLTVNNPVPPISTTSTTINRTVPVIVSTPPVIPQPPIVIQQPVIKPVTIPQQTKKTIVDKSVSTSTAVQNTQAQKEVTSTQNQILPQSIQLSTSTAQTETKSSSNVFLKIWNFIKNIF